MKASLNLACVGEAVIDIPEWLSKEVVYKAFERREKGDPSRDVREYAGDIIMEWILYGRLLKP